LDQVEGECLDHLRVTETIVVNHDFIDFQPAEEAIKATGADIRHGGDRAYYRPPIIGYDGDFIQMPPKKTFLAPKEFYATALHELMHWSERRVGWTGMYGEGELRAEIAACYALAKRGVPQSDDLTNHHSYLENWLSALQRDPRFIFTSATAASKAVDFVLGFNRTPSEVPKSEELVVS
jgi:antirestriction protein ArdC